MLKRVVAVQLGSKLGFLKEDPDLFFFCFVVIFYWTVTSWSMTLWFTVFACVFRRSIESACSKSRLLFRMVGGLEEGKIHVH